MEYETWLKDAAVFLVAAGLVAPLFRALRQSAVLAFLCAGVVLGPFGLGSLTEQAPLLRFVTIEDPHAAEPFAELGVLFLLFLIGLELSFARLWALRREVFGMGAVQVIGAAIVIGAIALGLGQGPAPAIIIALALALSSTAIVMQVLSEEREAATPVGGSAFSVLLFQDIAVAPILILVAFLGASGGGEAGESSIAALIGTALLGGLAAVAAIGFIGRFVLRRAMRLAALAGGRDMMMALTLLAVGGAAAATGSAGLSVALGAFLAGLLLGETEFGPQIEIDIEPFKGLLLGLFFMTVGMSVDPVALFASLPLILGLTLSLILVKSASVYLSARLFGVRRGRAAHLAALLGPAGEFAFVVLGAAGAAGVIEAETAAIVASVAALSMFAIPILGRLGGRVSRRDEAASSDLSAGDPDAGELDGHVVIAGLGRVGRVIGELLAEEGAEIIAIDIHPDKVRAGRERGVQVFYGDAGRAETLEKAGLDRAALVLVSLDNPGRAERMVRAARPLCTKAPILARARDRDHADLLTAAGADFVIHESLEVGLQLAAKGLEAFGLSPDAARQRLLRARAEAYASGEE